MFSYLRASPLVWTAAVKFLGVVTVGTKQLEPVFGEAVTFQPSIDGSPSTYLPPMFSTVIMNVIDLEKIFLRLATTGTRATVCRNDFPSDCLIVFPYLPETILAMNMTLGNYPATAFTNASSGSFSSELAVVLSTAWTQPATWNRVTATHRATTIATPLIATSLSASFSHSHIGLPTRSVSVRPDGHVQVPVGLLSL
jgi:hypothetical protein